MLDAIMIDKSLRSLQEPEGVQWWCSHMTVAHLQAPVENSVTVHLSPMKTGRYNFTIAGSWKKNGAVIIVVWWHLGLDVAPSIQ